jgi:hypothetical protein
VLVLLSFSATSAHATEINDKWQPPADTSQFGKVENSTSQTAESSAETKQKNFNFPISFATVGSNNGNVDQYNDADTTAKSENWNDTWQSLWQTQKSEDEHSNDGWSKDGSQYKDGQQADGASQSGIVSNETGQEASSYAETKQANVNAPISVFSVGSNNGSVDQYNDADTQAKSENGNQTSQELDQQQTAEGSDGNGSYGDCKCGGDSYDGRDGYSKDHESDGGASQYGKVENSTEQEAQSSADTKQVNVNAPISAFSVGSNNGDVNQGNTADTQAKSENGNETWQQADQNQQVEGDNNHGSYDGCGCDGRDGYNSYDQGGDWNRNGQDASASQSGKVENETGQSASSDAQTKQFNLNAPISLFSVGSNNGDVNQGNDANTEAQSSNWNDTGQLLGQQQLIG